MSLFQVAIITIHVNNHDYAKGVSKKLFENGFEVEYKEYTNESFARRIRSAQLEKFNFILVIGRTEEANGTVNVRTREAEVC
jgi:threonyl-tRNA synthetase